MDEFESLKATRNGVRTLCGVHSQVPQEDAVRAVEAALGRRIRRLAMQKENRIEEGHLMPDHVHMLLSVPPKYAVSQVVGYIKGKSAIHLARTYGGRRRNLVGAALLGEGVLRLNN